MNVKVYIGSSIYTIAGANVQAMQDLNRHCKAEFVNLSFVENCMRVEVIHSRKFKIPAKVKDIDSLVKWAKERIEVQKKADKV